MKRIAIYIAMIVLVPATLAAQSVLATGRWWKMEVSQSGLHRLTTADLPALAGLQCDSLAVYASAPGMLELRNSLTPLDDLQQVGTEVVDRNGNGIFDAGDELRFFAHGADHWAYDEGLARWTFRTHGYAATCGYFLTASCAAPLRVATAPTIEPLTTQDFHTVVAHVDNNLVSPFQTGQTWLGERFSSSTPSRTVTLTLPSPALSHVHLRYALASVSAAGGSFTLATQDYNRQTTIGSNSVYASVQDELTTAAPSYTFSLTYRPGETSATGYLDYIELNARATIAFDGGQTLVRSGLVTHTATAFTATARGAFRVWDVSTPGAEHELVVTGGTWVDSTTCVRQYILFDESHFHAPDAIGPIENQNLHGSPAADLVIIALPQYMSQARRLATLHEVFDGLDCSVVTDQQVFNEFSSGQQDPIAFRSYLRWLRQQHPGQPPRYLILFGKGTFDNRHRQYTSTPTLATYETPQAFDDDGRSYCSDDILGFLDENASGSTGERMDASVGRLPARDTAEARHLVDKLEAYITRRDLADDGQRGDWRNYIALLADDADPGSPHDSVFAHSSEVVARNILRRYPQLHIDRLYADAYRQSSGAIGSYYPDLNNALRQRIDYGCLLLNYIGHGSTEYIGTERYIEPADLAAYSNTHRLPLLVTSTCSYGHFDLPEALCGAEAAILAPAGMIAAISASRPISHSERFNNEVVIGALNPANTIGDALRLAKNRYPSPLCIGITGDPALRLSQPTNRIRITHINQQPVDDTTDVHAKVLSRVTIVGEIIDSAGIVLTDFDGTIYPIVYDRPMRTSTLANDNPGTEVSFMQQKSVLYKGSHPVSGGRFEYSFIVPADVSYRYDYAKLSHYAKSGSDHAAGTFLRLKLGGLSDSTGIIPTPPRIHLYIGDTNFRPGGITGPNPSLLALISDSAGINTGTGLGHDLTALLDDNPASLIVLNDLYQPDITDSRRGTVSYTLRDLAPGHHTLTLKAWNIFGLSASATTHFTVRGNDTLAISDLHCSPNPATTHTTFTLRTNCPHRITTAELQIYNSRGQLILSHNPQVSTQGYIIGPVHWDVSTVPPGIYLARMLLTDNDGNTHVATAKCIVH